MPTRWTLVRAAGGADGTASRRALEELCRTYWLPLYGYVRRRGHRPHDAEDLTQGFFARLLRLRSLEGLQSERGRFRAFLLASMKHYLSDERDKQWAACRDERLNVTLDAEAAEQKLRHEPTEGISPERLFARQWALTLLETVVERLSAEYHASGRGMLFDALRFVIAGDEGAEPYAVVAGRLGSSEEAVRVAAHRLRKRYRAILHEEIAQTLDDPADVADELRELRRSLAP
ncbi:RNA polymerase sigma factor [Haloferula sargassicola]|uniref:RNA polymerase sigma factor n=1 Tax=Haloferula sargassicola TaxID=490096 RepID=UPI0033654ACC